MGMYFGSVRARFMAFVDVRARAGIVSFGRFSCRLQGRRN